MTELYFGQAVKIHNLVGILIPFGDRIAIQIVNNSDIRINSLDGRFRYCHKNLFYILTDKDLANIAYFSEGSDYARLLSNLTDVEFSHFPSKMKLHAWLQRYNKSEENTCDIDVYSLFRSSTAGFVWSRTPEGSDFWSDFLGEEEDEVLETERKILEEHGISFNPVLTTNSEIKKRKNIII